MIGNSSNNGTLSNYKGLAHSDSKKWCAVFDTFIR
ncbi:hypothetical protein DFR44_10251 [Hydromonas duriensis]|uniref:Uncharacterized protein n=1 Tax=Hydromonas duriensis TaxID=1527608 RepID=A0A4R6YB56_9BURK|nr:hypothetical protein DFR44_10251 [Hydromonas duriensis]